MKDAAIFVNATGVDHVMLGHRRRVTVGKACAKIFVENRLRIKTVKVRFFSKNKKEHVCVLSARLKPPEKIKIKTKNNCSQPALNEYDTSTNNRQTLPGKGGLHRLN